MTTIYPPPSEENVTELGIAQRDGFTGVEAGEVARARQIPDSVQS